jgi:hypothetical protein
MKRILKSLLMAVALTGPFVAHLAAQTNTEVADIPFAFVVSQLTLPAGQYVVSQLHAGSPVFLIADGRRHSALVQLGNIGKGAPEKPSLTFACYGKECVLAKVTPPYSGAAYGLSQAAIEKNLSHKLGMAALVSVKIKAR